MKVGVIKEDLDLGRWTALKKGQIVIINAGEGVKKDQYSVTVFKTKDSTTWGMTCSVFRKDVDVLSGFAKQLFYLLFR